MIPKIIHYCWLSNDPFPPSIQKCIDSWKKIMPDYKLILWNFNHFPKNKSLWVDQAFDNKKYAFAADYIRLYALYNYGGIYMDSDVEVLKSFDDLLELPYFVGKENSPYGIEAATIGCEKGWDFITPLLKRYDSLSFIKSNGAFDERPIPCIIRNYIDSNYEYNTINSISEFNHANNVINVFPVDFFSPKTWDTKEINCTDRTYSIHHFSASWKDNTSENIFRDYSNSLWISFRKKIGAYKRQRQYRTGQCCIVSNVSNITSTFYYYFKVKSESPFVHSDFTKNDFLNYLLSHKTFDNKRIEFIKTVESHSYKPEMDYCPIGRFVGTNIEMQFTQGLVKSTEYDLWKENVHYIDEKTLVFVFVCPNITSEQLDIIRKSTEYVIICTNKKILYPYSVYIEDINDDNMRTYMYNVTSIMANIINNIKELTKK